METLSRHNQPRKFTIQRCHNVSPPTKIQSMEYQIFPHTTRIRYRIRYNKVVESEDISDLNIIDICKCSLFDRLFRVYIVFQLLVFILYQMSNLMYKIRTFRAIIYLQEGYKMQFREIGSEKVCK